MVSGSRKYPTDTSRLRPFSGAHMNSHNCTPNKAEDSNTPAIKRGLAANSCSSSHTRRHSPLTIMNTVMHGTVSNMRQPKISRPLKGVSNDVK
jgi:hypothetical protein